jgi:hypothetical protein
LLQKKNIIFIIIIVIIVVTGSIVIYGNFSSKPGRPPQITISEEEWDFGKVMLDVKPSHKFTITNKGNEDLIIERVRASCGCVQTSISTNRILSGKSAELEAVFSTVGYEGKLEKIIFINSNDPNIPEKRIKLKIEVEHQFKPKINIFGIEQGIGIISQGDIVNLSLTIENQGDAELIIDKIDTYEHIRYNNILPLIILPKEKLELTLIYDSTEHELGEIREAVRVNCNDPTTESFVIRISGYIKEKETPGISISPTEAIFNLAHDSETGAIGKFTIKNSGAETVKIISMKSSSDYLAPLRSELSLKSGEKQNLQILLLKDKAREGIKENKSEEYLYLTIAIPIKINK